MPQARSIEKHDGPPPAGTGDKGTSVLVPHDKEQMHFTDPESRIMRDNATKSFEQASAQLAVVCATQVIVSADVTKKGNDKQQLVPLTEQIENNTVPIPDGILADPGISAPRMFNRV